MADWRDNLSDVFKTNDEKRHEKEPTQMARFITEVAVPAFGELRGELEQHGRDVTVRAAEGTASVAVRHHGEEEITYRIQSRVFPNGVLPYADVRYRERKGLKLIRMESMFRSGQPDYTIHDVTKDEVIQSFLKHYLPLVQRD